MLNQTKRIVIIGGGPAGYEAALAGAKYGAEITIIEDQGMGGNSVISASFQVFHRRRQY